jgi:hypothetical protein
MVNILEDLKAAGKVVNCIRSVNAGENKSFQQASMKHQLNIKFVYSCPGTPQLNGKANEKLGHFTTDTMLRPILTLHKTLYKISFFLYILRFNQLLTGA